MTIDDIVKVPMPAADAGAALIAGQVPVAVTYEPYLTLAMQQDPKVKMIYSAGEDPGLISDVFVVREEFLNERPGAVAALLKAWDAALADYKADTDGGPGDHLRGGGRQARGARHRLRRRGLLLARREQDRARRPLHHQGHPGREGRRAQGRHPDRPRST